MDFERIQRIIRLSKESVACEIVVETPVGKVRVVRRPMAPAPVQRAEPAKVVEPATAAQEAAEPLPAGDLVVRSRHVGWFHRGEGPGTEPFIQVGDKVREGQPLGTIETLKMSNPVTAPARGTVKEILVEEGEEVEYAQELFILTVGGSAEGEDA